jgi:hypothetical protein
MVLEIGGRAGINHQHLGADGIECGGLADKIVYLAGAKGTLITRPTAQNNEHNRRFDRERFQFNGLVIKGSQSEIWGGITLRGRAGRAGEEETDSKESG